MMTETMLADIKDGPDLDLIRQINEEKTKMAAETWESIEEMFGPGDGQILYDALISGKIPHVVCEWVVSE